MTEPQEEIRTEDTQPDAPAQDPLDALRRENETLQARLIEAESAAESGENNEALLRKAQTENQQLRDRLVSSASEAAINRAAEQLGVPAAMAKMHAHKFTCELDDDGLATLTPDPVEFFQTELKRDPTLRAAVEGLASRRRTDAAAVGAVAVEQADPVELLASLDRSSARKTRFIARHGVKAYLTLCDRARRC